MSTDDLIEQLPSGIALAWGVAATPQRGPKREMSVEKIVDAAIEIADSDGIQAVSMSAVAKRLGYTPMSLYRYVSSKDDLLLLMQEEATGLPPEAAEEGLGWRARLGELYEAQSRIYARRSWLLSMPITGSPITPNSSAWLEAGLESLCGTGLTEEERIAVSLLVTGAARWKGLVAAGYEEQSRTTGLDADEVAAREQRLFDAVITEDGYPFLRQAIDAGVFASEFDPFDFGLERGFDGVEAFIDGIVRARTDAVSDTADDGSSSVTSADASDDAAERAAEGQAAIANDDPAVAADKKLREAQKAVRQAQKVLAEARKRERQVLREAKERVAKRR
ncbi:MULTISPECIES: TetR/AcrR family transcriptional regulator [unclassified Brevibacterium]|uniref:TetR/AcrR family transcriptional regulator n=1 Tax=unclassified Brevibacterium TaxID=2614124 RepID=UPI0010930CE8|nr:TetR/AcrR family transcriptional regulator [Brevibacterium sp. S22]TGD27294.1 TetR family transcriptional regulator [Brevibacterium sp. S22]